MDILARHGELSPEDLTEISAMSKDELVALVIGMNKGWYQLLANLEDAHRQDLTQLEERFLAQLNDSLSATRKTESEEIAGLREQFAKSGKELDAGLKASKENEKRLEALKSTLDKLTNVRTGGR